MSRAGTHPKEQHHGDGPCAACVDPKTAQQVALLRGVAAIGCPARVVAEVARSMPDEVLAEAVREPEPEGDEARKQREAFEAREQLSALEREREEWQGKLAVALGHTRQEAKASANGPRGRWEWLTREACKLLLRATNQTPEAANVATEDTEEPAESPPKKKRGRPQKEARTDEERAAFEEELAAAVGGAGWVLKRALLERTGKVGAWRVQVERGNEFKTAIVKLPEGAGPYSREALRYFRANIAAQLSGDPGRAVHPDDRQTCVTCKKPLAFDESKIGETVGGLTLKGWNYCDTCDEHTLSRRGVPFGKNPGSGTRKELAAELRTLSGEVEDDEREQGPSARRGPSRRELARAIDAKNEAKKVEARRLPPGSIVSRLAQDASNPAREIGVVGALDDGAADVNDDGEPLIEWTWPADSIDAGETWQAYEAAADLRVELEPRKGAPWPVFNSWSEVAAERRARQGQGELFAKGGAS